MSERAGDRRTDSIGRSSTPRRCLRWPVRLAIWTVITTASAVPSYLLGASMLKDADTHWGMVAGILVWIVVYTVASGTDVAIRLQRARRSRIAMRIGYLTRIGVSILTPLTIIVDLSCGVPSIAIGEALTGANDTLAFAFVTTVVQGAVLNVGIAAYVLLVFGILCRFMRGAAREGQCMRCGYDLRGTPSGRCPECGTPAPALVPAVLPAPPSRAA